ncbi:SMI1/KNR4 family protein [Microvenator marinus]|uniref:SMI1/KNR4 family protein n=1 Tax=Microvenator marinus TaxID=2600177 RepID=A0A5B8XWH0_9DELT|nr:SMI1/KNR4 family protein [Microvenator marinus]QED29890.1 SMI1/KNR4 family protein [Microvenator marinus]
MGFFDKIKNFVGGHGVTVHITELEGGAPKSVNFQLSQSVLKGTFEVHTTNDVEILSYNYRMTAHLEDEGMPRSVVVAEGEIEGKEASAGEVIKHSFALGGIDLAGAMARLDLDADAPVIDPRVLIEFAVTADVKGTPMDASAKETILVVDDEPAQEAAPSQPAAVESRPWDFKERIDAMMAALEACDSTLVRVAEIGEPVSQQEIDEVHAKIGYELDPRFLDFFRAANGIRVIWVTSYFDQHDDPIDHYHAQVEMNTCGRINVPRLSELFEQPGYLFGWDYCQPKEHTQPCLGGWDEFALRSALRNIDDFEQTNNDSSYRLLGLVQSERYPDPPVLLTDDYAAALSDGHPMLARDYLAFVIATLGRPQERYQRLRSRGFSKNHALFVPNPGWLDVVPEPAKILAVMHDQVSLEENQAVHAILEDVSTQNGVPVEKSAYASYNETPAGPPRVASTDPLEGMRVADPDPDWANYLQGLDTQLIMPLYDESHYTIKEPVSNEAALAQLIGQPVKAKTQYGTEIGCLIKVENGAGTLFNAGQGYMGTSGFQIDGSEIGRAWYLS